MSICASNLKRIASSVPEVLGITQGHWKWSSWVDQMLTLCDITAFSCEIATFQYLFYLTPLANTSAPRLVWENNSFRTTLITGSTISTRCHNTTDREKDGHTALCCMVKSNTGKMQPLSYNTVNMETRYRTVASNGKVNYTNPELFEAKCDFRINTNIIAVKFIASETQLSANGFHRV